MQRDADVSNIISSALKQAVRYDYIHLYFQNRRSIHLRKDVMQVILNMLWIKMIWETEILLTQSWVLYYTSS